MARDARIRFIAELVDKFSPKAKNIKTSMAEMEKGSKKTEKGISSFASTVGIAATAAAGFAVAAKKAFDSSKQGAQVEQMRRSFSGLGISIDALRDAAGGTVDDMTLMASSAKLVAGVTGELRDRMAEAAPQLLEVARAAVKLDPSIGSVAYVFESLARGIKKNQPLLIDNSNIAVKVGDANRKMAEQLGKSVDELTEEEKALALLNDTLRAGDEIIEQVGGTVDSLTDSYARAEAAAKNWSDTQKAALSQSFNPIINAIADELEQTNKINEAISRGIIRQEDYSQALHHTAGQFENLDALMRFINYHMEAGAVLNQRYTSALEDVSVAVSDIAEDTPIDIFMDVDTGILSEMDQMRDKIKFLQAGGDKLAEKWELVKENIGKSNLPLKDQTSILTDLQLQAIALELETKKLTLRQAIDAARDLGLSYSDAYGYLTGTINKTKLLDGMSATVYVDIITSGSLPKFKPGGGGSYTTTQAQTAGGIYDYQAGANFVVPPRFTGDSMRIGATAGERVQIRSAGQTQQGSLEEMFSRMDLPDRIADRLAHKLIALGAFG